MQAMQQMMERMMTGMEGCCATPRKEIYPLLMGLPAWTAETRVEVDRLARGRIDEGMGLVQTAHVRLSDALREGDHSASARALHQAREGINAVGIGVAAHRLLSEGTSPQSGALQWFRDAMDLPDPQGQPHGLFGLTWFHYFSIVFLLATSAAMVAIYLARARRAAALFADLTRETTSARVGGAEASIARAPPPIAPSNAPVGLKPSEYSPSKSNSWSGPLRVARIFRETAQVKTFRLIESSGGPLPFKYLPGQFLTFTVVPHGQSIKRSYTIASSPTRREYCEVTVRHEEAGVVSGYLHEQVHEGELLHVTAPSGKFTFAGEGATSIVLIAGGVGVTPMMSVIRYLTDRSWSGDIYLIYGCKIDADLIFRDEIEYLKTRFANLHVTLVAEQITSADWPYHSGRITQALLAAAVPNIDSRHIHLCGPNAMMAALKVMLADLGVPATQVETEVFIGKERPQRSQPQSVQAADAPDRSISTEAREPVPSPAVSAPVKVALATFARSGKTAPLPPGKTLLEAAEEVGVDIEYSCREGVCGVCRTKLLSGTVTMEVDDGLDPADRAQNWILACQAKASSDVSVDA